MVEPNPITYRMLFGNSDPRGDSIVTCNCNWDEGHEANCDIVLVWEYIREHRYDKII